MKFKTATALMLLALAAVVPACEIDQLTRECNPYVEHCVYTGQHPSTLAEHP